ncbi:MAG: formate/nitrite transporter family protein [Solidesulfovibrio sp. DCME]|uniref:formate/nitrite transporter family protein n=1 Tax=Solidesulfovibrio sp. DCME TaxID=3447380 RepID=UPI003D143BEB
MAFVAPPDVAKNCCSIQQARVKLSVPKMLVLDLAAGFYISFGAETSIMVSHDLTALGAGFQRFMLASIFSVGLMIVINGGAELFTGNCLLWVAYMDRKISTYELLRSCLFVATLYWFSYVRQCKEATNVVACMKKAVNE